MGVKGESPLCDLGIQIPLVTGEPAYRLPAGRQGRQAGFVSNPPDGRQAGDKTLRALPQK